MELLGVKVFVDLLQGMYKLFTDFENWSNYFDIINYQSTDWDIIFAH